MSVKVNTIHFYTHEIIIIIMHLLKTIIFIDIINNFGTQENKILNVQTKIAKFITRNLTAQICGMPLNILNDS